MHINEKLFQEIDYVAPTDASTIDYDSTDAEFVESIIRLAYPQLSTESDDDYVDRINDELASDPIVGIINDGTLLAQAVDAWVAAGHPINLIKLDSRSGYNECRQRYFLTRDTNYNVIDMDLLGGNDDGSKESQFLAFVNSID